MEGFGDQDHSRGAPKPKVVYLNPLGRKSDTVDLCVCMCCEDSSRNRGLKTRKVLISIRESLRH